MASLWDNDFSGKKIDNSDSAVDKAYDVFDREKARKSTTDWLKTKGLAYGDESLVNAYSPMFFNGSGITDAENLYVSNQFAAKGHDYWKNFQNQDQVMDAFNKKVAQPGMDLDNLKRTGTDNFMDTYGKPAGLALSFANEAAKLYGMNKQWDFMDDKLKMMKEDQGMKRELFNQQNSRNKALGNYQFSPNNTAVV
jgi:hypothetical protein